MSRFAKKAGQKSNRFQFDVIVNFVEVHIPIEASVMVIWKRGAKRIETREKVTISPDNPRGEFSEQMSMFATLSKDMAKNKYVEKNTTFTVKLLTESKVKSIGMIKMNLAKYAEKDAKTEELNLKKCPDRNAIISLTIKNTLIQADCKDADTLSQMTDLRSLDSAPDSQYDFTELNKEREEESLYDNKIDPMELLKRDHDRQKKGLPPMFGGQTSAFKNITADQFSLKSKAATSTMSSMHAGPIRPNKLRSKDDVSETPEKMEDCDITTDEEGNISKSPSNMGQIRGMPDTSETESEVTPKNEKPQRKKIQMSAISKIKKSKKRDDPDTKTTAFSYKEGRDSEEEEKSHSRRRVDSSEGRDASFKIVAEAKELRAKIRTLEMEKRALQEVSPIKFN